MDLSDDVPAVYVALITLEEWQAAREEPSVRWVYFVLYCPSPSLTDGRTLMMANSGAPK